MSAQYFKGCSLKSAAFTTSKQKQTPCLALQFNVPIPDEGDIERTVYLYVSDSAIQYTDEKLERLGFNGNFEAPEFSNAGDVELSRKFEVYEGKDQERWDIARGGGGGFEHPAGPADVARRLSQRWRAMHGTKPASAPAKPAAPAPKKAPPPPAKKPESTVTTKDEAWEEYLRLSPGVDENVVNERFYASIEKVAKGRDEVALVAKDWQAVVGDCVPF